MAHLIDTSVLARLANRADSRYHVGDRAVVELHRRGEILHITPQVLIEFRSVATRPATLNGLGRSATEVEVLSAGFEAAFSLLPETPELFAVWKSLVQEKGVIGKQVHDARLAAVCRVHGVSHLLTFNVGHFARFAGITAVDPSEI